MKYFSLMCGYFCTTKRSECFLLHCSLPSSDGKDAVFRKPRSIITLLSYCILLSQTSKASEQELTRPRQMDVYLFSCLHPQWVVLRLTLHNCLINLSCWALLENGHGIWSNVWLQTGFVIRMQVPQGCGFLWYSSLRRDHCDPGKWSQPASSPTAIQNHTGMSHRHTLSHMLHIMAILQPQLWSFCRLEFTIINFLSLSFTNLEKRMFSCFEYDYSPSGRV